MIIDANVNIKMLGFGTALPDGPPVSNVDLLSHDPGFKEKDLSFLGGMSARIEAKFGVCERYLTRKPWEPERAGEDTSEELAFRALRDAWAGRKEPSPALFIHGTTTTSRYTGSQAASILGRLGIVAPAYEIKAGCSTSLASLHMAVSFLLAGYPNVAVACAETLSKVMHPEIRETWFGLADGGAALWFERNDATPDFRILKSYYSTDGKHADLFTTPGLLPPSAADLERRNYCLQGDKDVLSRVSREHYSMMLDRLFSDNCPLSGIHCLIPHQVNLDLIRDVLKSRMAAARLVWNAREFGNLGGASILFSLAECLRKGIFSKNERILLISVGGGLSFAAQIWEKL